MTTSLESQESDLDSTFHEPNPGFKALLSKWKVQDTDSAATASPCRSHIATIAQRKSRTVAKQEYEERRKEEIEHRKSSGVVAGETTASKKAAARMQLKNVYQHSLGVEAFTPKVLKKDVLDKELVLAALEKNFVFSDLSRTALAPLVDAFEQCSFSKGEVIIRQGDPGDYFYIIKSGRVNFLVNERPVGKAKKGASFGELSLLYTCPRAATVIAAEATTLFRVDQITFRYILQSQTQQWEHDKEALLQNVNFLKDLTGQDLKKLSSVMTPRVFQENELIVKKGDVGDAFYVIQEGTVLVKDISVGSTVYEDQTLGPGEYFGERSLATSEPRAANVVGVTKGVAFSIDRHTFEMVLGKMSNVIMRAQDVRKLAGVKILKRAELDGRQLATLADRIVDKKFWPGKAIMRKGDKTSPALYFLREGKLELIKDSGTDIIEAGGYFGELLFKNTPAVEAPYTVRIKETCVCGVLTISSSKEVFDTACLGDEAMEAGTGTPQADGDMPVAPPLTTSANLNDLKRHKILGEGTFGQVWLVSEHMSDGTNRAYALKIQSKFDLAGERQINAVLREKMIMQQMRHPFIIQLVKTYQDPDFVYILLEMIQGGELFSVLHRDEDMMGLPEAAAKFYGYCVADALAYMHRSKFVFRDLKPENLMIDKMGYPVVIDFGFAKHVTGKTYTLCGTPGYLPPEVVMTRGHNISADHWSYGILLYEMLTGENPFFYDGMDQISLFEAIVQDDYDEPRNVSVAAVDIIRKLLVKDPTRRLGSLARGEDDILDHPWFSDLDLQLLRRRQLPAPWLPDVRDPLDTSCFDDWDHLEDKTKQSFQRISEQDEKLFEGF